MPSCLQFVPLFERVLFMFPTLVTGLLAIVGAYLCGSIPFGLLIGRWAKGVDLREHGSRNIGATNAGRVLGTKWGLVVLLLDALKGLLPTLLLPWLACEFSVKDVTGDEVSLRGHLEVACGLGGVIGHMFPCWLGFRGGKGVATSLGVIGVLSPWATLIAVATFAVTLFIFRYVSLSSILAAVAFAIAGIGFLWPSPFSPEDWSRSAFCIAAPLLVIYRHRSNIVRLRNGEEAKLGERTNPQPETREASETTSIETSDRPQ